MGAHRSAALLAGLLCFMAAFAIVKTSGLPERASFTATLHGTAPEIGQMAPDFRAKMLRGGDLQLTTLRGTPVILNFWATWCVPCEAEMPELQRLSDAFPSDQLHVLAVNTGEVTSTIEAWVARLQLSLLIALDSDLQITSAYAIRGQPQTFVLDGDGVVRAIFYGPVDYERLHAAVEPYL